MSNDDWSTVFQSRLEVLRQRYGVSKAEMARKSGIPPRTLENYFKGQKPSVDNILAISDALNVDVDWLLGKEARDQALVNDNVGEASWLVLERLFQEMIEASMRGEPVLSDSKILGKESGELAARIEAKIMAEFLALRHDYAMPSADQARNSLRSRTTTDQAITDVKTEEL